jgi:hypothetical protein
MICKCNKLKLLLSGALLVIIISTCSTYDIAGTGTETSTKDSYACAQGVFVDETGKPSENTVVQLIPESYNPVSDSALDSVSLDTTDKDGKYTVYSRKSGRYNVFAVSSDKQQMALVSGLQMQFEKVSNVPDSKVLTVGTIRYTPTDKQINEQGYIYIPGTTLYKVISQPGVCNINAPSTRIAGVWYTRSALSDERIAVTDSITVKASDTTRCFNVLLIVGTTTAVSVNDKPLISSIESLGGKITLVNDDSLRTVSYDHKNIIIISSTCEAVKLDSFFAKSTIPVIVSEVNLFGVMNLTGKTYSVEYGFFDSLQSNVYVTKHAHPITEGINGDITVLNRKDLLGWGIPGTGADVLMTANQASSKSVLFCYEKGAQMSTLSAPAKRVAISIISYTSVLYSNSIGWKIFEQSVVWCLTP